jgi:hypothetical protein
MKSTAEAIFKTPTLIHDVPDYDLELTIREVVEFAVERDKAKRAKHPTVKRYASASSHPKKLRKHYEKHARRIMFFVGEVYKRNPDFACAIINHYAERGCNVNTLIKTATSLKNDPKVQGFLDYLRTTLKPGHGSEDAYLRGRRMVRRTIETACQWAGLDAATTREKVRYIRVS